MVFYILTLFAQIEFIMSDSLKETPTFPSETSNQDDSTVLEKTEDNTQSNGSNTNPKGGLDKEQMDGMSYKP